MNSMSRSTTRSPLSLGGSTKRSLDFQPVRSGGASEFGGLSAERYALPQTFPRSIKRAASTALATLERSVFQNINQYRQQQGLSSMRLNSAITQQARQHSQSMANHRALSHDGFSSRVLTIRNSIPLRASAENVAFNQGFSNPTAQIVNGWLKSPGHFQNIMGDYNLTGVGVAQNNQGEFYFTQVFIKR